MYMYISRGEFSLAGKRGVAFTRSVYATCVSRDTCAELSPAKSFRHRARTATSPAKSSAETSQFARIPTVSFPAARLAQFSALTLWLPFCAVFPYEKRSAVSFPPDVAPSKDTGEHWTLLHEIYSYMYVRSASTFLEQLSIFDCDPLPPEALVAVKACSREREITPTVKKAKAKPSLFFSRNPAPS